MKKPVLANSGNMERNTPKELVEMARRVLGRIDLDPASNDIAQETVRADGYYNGICDVCWAVKDELKEAPHEQ